MRGQCRRARTAGAALAAALWIFAAAGCGRQAAEPLPRGAELPGDVAAAVNGETISREVLEGALAELRKGKSHGTSPRQLLEELVRTEVLRQEAVRQGLEEDPAVREGVRSTAHLSLALLYQATLRREYIASREIELEGIEALLQERSEPGYETEVILVPSREDSLAVYERLKAGEDFNALAREISIGITAPAGGRLGLRPDKYFQDMFGFSVTELNLPAGMVSNPIETEVGFVILRIKSVAVPAQLERLFQEAVEDAQERQGGRTYDSEVNPAMVRGIPVEWSRAYLDDGTLRPESIDGRPVDMPEGVYARLGGLELNTETITARFHDLFEPEYAGNFTPVLEVVLAEEYFYTEALAKRPELQEDPGFKRGVARRKSFLLRKKLIADQVEARIVVEDPEVQRYYDENLALFIHGPQWEVGHILTRDAQEAAKVVEEYRAGSDFAHLALKYSLDDLKAKGGYLGIIARGQLIPPLDQGLEGLEEGGVSAPIRSEMGYHVIKVIRILPPAHKSLAEARPEILRTLRDQKLTVELKAFQESLSSQAEVVINEPLLAELEKKSRAGGAIGHGF